MWEPSKAWLTRFLHRNHRVLTTSYATLIETGRHKANSSKEYRLYFEELHGVIERHGVTAENTYNIDRKGFMIGIVGKSNRIFDRVLFEKKQYKQSTHNSNRE
jgi:hypothetical protein